MPILSAKAIAHPNIAFIKYWGNQSQELRIPVNGSISMNMAGLETVTSVIFDDAISGDTLSINGKMVEGKGLERVSSILEIGRRAAGIHSYAQVISSNNFPTGAGIASSAAAFAALAKATVSALGLPWDEPAISRLARMGSGSASRSVPGGFVEWYVGESDETSYAETIAPAEHWALADCVAIVSASHKKTGSTEGHALAPTSPLQGARVADTPRRLELCRNAIRERDIRALAEVIELDSNIMHAVMMTSSPALFYWQPETLAVMAAVREWREDGLLAGYTIDAGANIHVICEQTSAAEVQTRLRNVPGVQRVLMSSAGGGAKLV